MLGFGRKRVRRGLREGESCSSVALHVKRWWLLELGLEKKGSENALKKGGREGAEGKEEFGRKALD